MTNSTSLSRRAFLRGMAAAGTIAALPAAMHAAPARQFPPPISIFSKVFQELKLDFDQAAALTAEAGFDGIDCPVRDKGEIEPGGAVDDMPKYAQTLHKHHVEMLLVTTGILSVDSPHARDILTAAKNLGIHYYRIGFLQGSAKISDVIENLKGLAALNKELGITAVLENHSGPRLGGNLDDMHQLVKDFDPAQVGVAFDLGHAIIVHGDDWTKHFEQLKSHIKVAYIKDIKRPAKFVPFGEGEFGKTDFFKRLKQLELDAPLSLHMEYDWSNGGKEKTRDKLLKEMTAANHKLKEWLAETSENPDKCCEVTKDYGMIKCTPMGICSWNFNLSGIGHTAQIEFNWVGEQGTIVIDGQPFQVCKQGVLSGHWTLEENSTVLFSAEKSTFLRTFNIQTPAGLVRLRADSLVGRRMAMEGGGFAAVLAPAHAFTRRASITGEIPDFRTACFGFWLTVLLWRRAARDASSS